MSLRRKNVFTTQEFCAMMYSVEDDIFPQNMIAGRSTHTPIHALLRRGGS